MLDTEWQHCGKLASRRQPILMISDVLARPIQVVWKGQNATGSWQFRISSVIVE
jgi:hypothetical protein